MDTSWQVRAQLRSEQLKPFVNAIQCASKTGKEITFECTSSAFTLRTLNDSHAASAAIEFRASFFHEYILPRCFTESMENRGQDQAPCIKCTTLASTCQSIFRSLKNVIDVYIILDIDPASSAFEMLEATEIVFQLHCNQMITKTHRIKLNETQSWRPVFNKDASPCTYDRRCCITQMMCLF
jgi:hypothetical protein